MKKIRISFMFLTFIIAIGSAFAFTSKNMNECLFMRECDNLEVPIPISEADYEQLQLIDGQPCKYASEELTTLCTDTQVGCGVRK